MSSLFENLCVTFTDDGLRISNQNCTLWMTLDCVEGAPIELRDERTKDDAPRIKHSLPPNPASLTFRQVLLDAGWVPPGDKA